MKRTIFTITFATIIATAPVYAAKPVPVEVPFDNLATGVEGVIETNAGNIVIVDDDARVLLDDVVSKIRATDFVTGENKLAEVAYDDGQAIVPLTTLGGTDLRLEAKVKTGTTKNGKPKGPSETIYGTERFLDGRADIDWRLDELGYVCEDEFADIEVFSKYSSNGLTSIILEPDTVASATNAPLYITIPCEVTETFGSQRVLDDYVTEYSLLDVKVTHPDIYGVDLGADGVIDSGAMDVDPEDNIMDSTRAIFPGEVSADQPLIRPAGEYNNWSLGGEVQDWMTIDPRTGLISLTPQSSNTAGDYVVNVQADGPSGVSDVFYINYNFLKP